MLSEVELYLVPMLLGGASFPIFLRIVFADHAASNLICLCQASCNSPNKATM